ncbi:phage tail protein [Photobacterium sp. SP02]|uniref:phage tail protein n=1 Tax=Photobacterium sp. SP02 TaxID=3032280 RepID=UPI003144FDE0
MVGLNTQMVVDTEFLEKFKHLPDELNKAVRRAIRSVNNWFKAVTMAELGFELNIEAKSFRTRFRVYQSGRTSKLWVGVRKIGVHRLGKPVQTKSGVQVGEHFFDGAFINPMDSDQLLVFRRTMKGRKSIQLVTMDISDQAEEIIDSYLPELNRKFEEHFHREFRYVLSGAQ